jgi:hypothetical protein
VLENRIDADLEAGNNGGLGGELEALIAEHPLRERLRGQLILALYRSGRQAEALEVYRETRRVLADELGLEPSPELRELERAILQHDPALRASPVSTAVATEPGVRPGRRRRLFIGVASLALVLAGLGAAVAVATHPTHAAQPQTTSGPTNEQNTRQLGWKSLEAAPSKVVQFFATLGNGAPLGMNPHVRANEVRTVPLPEGSVVWVAPAANGGICEEFALLNVAGCDHARTQEINTVLKGVGSVPCGARPDTLPTLLAGNVNAKPGATLQIEFSDGSFLPVGLTWIGPPINAGFWEQETPPRHHMTALVLRRPGGAILAKRTLPQALFTPKPCSLGRASSHQTRNPSR